MTAGVLFDLDETLLDRHSTLLRSASELYGDLERKARISRGDFLLLVEKLDGRGRAPREGFFTGLARSAFETITPEQLAEHFDTHWWLKPQTFGGVFELLKELKRRGLPIGIVTNGSKASQEAKIRNSGLSDLVDAAVVSEEAGVRKPDPRIFAQIHSFHPAPRESRSSVLGAGCSTWRRLLPTPVWLQAQRPFPLPCRRPRRGVLKERTG